MDPALFQEQFPEIGRLVDEIPKHGIIAIILFGSAAMGRLRPLSDIDLCVVTNPGIAIEEKEMVHSYASRKIQISLLTELPPAVQFRVFRDGQVLFCADPLALHRARVAALRSYLHTKPLRDRGIALALGRQK